MPPSWIFKNFKFLTVDGSRGSNWVTVPNFVAIGQIVAEIRRRFCYFSKMAAIRHVGFVMRMFRPPTKGI